MMCCFSRSSTGKSANEGPDARAWCSPPNMVVSSGMGSVQTSFEAAVVVDQITAHLLVLLADLDQRQDLAGLTMAASMPASQQSCRKTSEGDPRSRREAEADVAHPKNHMNARQVGGDAPDGFDGFAAIAPVFFDAG